MQLSSLTHSVQDLPTVLSPGQEDVESSRWQEETKVTVLQTDDTMEEAEEGSEPEANSEVIGDETPQAESTTVEGEASVPLNSEQNDSAEADQNHTNSVKKPSKAKLKKVTLQRTTAALHNRMRRSFARLSSSSSSLSPTSSLALTLSSSSSRSCCTLVADVASIEVGNGRWVDVSD